MRTVTLAASASLLVIDAPAAAQPAPPVQREIVAPAGRYAGFVTEAAQRFGVLANWIDAVMRAESAGNMRAVSAKGAMGLMQIMPETWAELRTRYGLGADPFDPRDNILAGAAYLREMYDRFGAPGFLAAYHAGPGRYDDYVSRGRALPAETRAYVAALAPMIGVAADAPMLVAAVEPDAWRRAPLFVVRDHHDAGDARDAAASMQPAPPLASRTTTDLPAIAQQSGGLFARRTVEALRQ